MERSLVAILQCHWDILHTHAKLRGRIAQLRQAQLTLLDRKRCAGDSSAWLSLDMDREMLKPLCLAVTEKSATTKKIRPRLRVNLGTDIALGPGKAELLELLDRTGSITKAAQGMGMSYMRAWSLIRTMNRCFKKPLVVAVRGGANGGGGATVTVTGHQALALYQRMSAECLRSIQPDWSRFQKLLRGGKNTAAFKREFARSL